MDEGGGGQRGTVDYLAAAQQHSTLLPSASGPPRLPRAPLERRIVDSMPGPGQYIPIEDWSKQKSKRGSQMVAGQPLKSNRRIGQIPLKADYVKGGVGGKDMIFDGGARKKLVI